MARRDARFRGERLRQAAQMYRERIDLPVKVIAAELGYASEESLRVMMHRHGVRRGQTFKMLQAIQATELEK